MTEHFWNVWLSASRRPFSIILYSVRSTLVPLVLGSYRHTRLHESSLVKSYNHTEPRALQAPGLRLTLHTRVGVKRNQERCDRCHIHYIQEHFMHRHEVITLTLYMYLRE
jgi:hypothetical protein